jgi:uncharacterized lipoprotein YmbA
MITLPEIRTLACGLMLAALTACSASKPSNYYLLSPLPSPESPIRPASSDQLVVGIGPVTLPGYLDRPQLVTRASANRLDMSEFDRWAEPLQDMFSRILAENLSALIGTDLVYVLPQRHIPKLDYTVAVEVLRFDRSVDGEAELLARWTVLMGDEGTTLTARKSLIAERVVPDDSPEATIVAMSRTVESLSREIARDLQGIAEHMTVSGYDLRAIQEALKSTGYDPGPADGIFGPRTREAIRRFQGEHGVRVTGEPSGQLQNMLMAMP